MSYHPNSEMVAVAWLAGITGLSADMVDINLPASDNATLATSGFVQVKAVAGSANIYIPQRTPAIQVDCWALNPASGRPPWNRAWHLANTIYAAVMDHATVPRAVSLPAAYNGASVQSVWTPVEPRVLPGDLGSYARVSLDQLIFAWVETT